VILLFLSFAEHDLLKKVPNNESYLLRFLYSTSFDVPAAFRRMRSFYEFLVEHPEWFAKDGPLNQKSLIEKDIRILTSLKDRGGRPIFLLKIGKYSLVLKVLSLNKQHWCYIIKGKHSRRKFKSIHDGTARCNPH
jgi:hypothetical protein